MNKWISMIGLLGCGISGVVLAQPAVPAQMACHAIQTAGFHDYAQTDEHYQAVVFYESEFGMRVNRVLTEHLADSPYDTFLTLTDDDEVVELQCVILRGIDNARGLSCANSPPSELLLLNLDNLRFTRSAIGGWTFAGANEVSAGDSIYVEYGRCIKK